MDLDTRLILEADRCVKCGACLPFCPTYQLYRDESESPRGRIALIQAFAAGQLDSKKVEQHLENCLHCLGCQSSCPSAVNYGEMIDGYKSHRNQQRARPLSRRLRWISTLPYRSYIRPLYWIYRNLGLRHLARTILGNRFRRLDDLLPPQSSLTPLNCEHPSQKPSARVGLFTGCIGRIADNAAHRDAIRVLNQLGVKVVTPKNQKCCGAIHQHNGFPNEANELQQNNANAFSEHDLDAILFLASGCGSELAKSPAFNVPVMELCQFLNQLKWDEQNLKPLDADIVVHTPCSQKNALKRPDDAAELLQRIPKLRVQPLEHPLCCGAGGSHLLQKPDQADQLRELTLKATNQFQMDFLATSNTGCAMHLRAGLIQSGQHSELVHPVQLIARQLIVPELS